TARGIVAALESKGWAVFWDTQIPPGREWADYIEEHIRACPVVVVLWSPHSVKSRWVRLEADHGVDRNPPALIPILIAETAIPFAFRDVHAATFTSWSPGAKGPEFDALVASIASRLRNTRPRDETRSQQVAKPPPASTTSAPTYLSPDFYATSARSR